MSECATCSESRSFIWQPYVLMKNFGMDGRKQYTPRLSPSKAGREFETRSLPRSLAATRRGFTFYVADPSAPFTTHTNRFQRTRVVTIRVSRVLNRSMPETKDELPAIGIIGGSGLYQIEELRDPSEHSVNTPFGPPSETLVGGKIS